MAIARWLAPAALATALGAAALAPVPAKAQSADLVRTIVDVADVVFRGGQPYYRYGNYGYDDRLVTGRDRYGRTVYYRVADPRYGAPPYGRAHGYHGNAPGQRKKCNRSGKCKVEYYDPRHDQRRYDARHDQRRYDDRYDNRYDDHYYGYGRWHDD